MKGIFSAVRLRNEGSDGHREECDGRNEGTDGQILTRGNFRLELPCRLYTKKSVRCFQPSCVDLIVRGKGISNLQYEGG